MLGLMQDLPLVIPGRASHAGKFNSRVAVAALPVGRASKVQNNQLRTGRGLI